GALGVVLAGGRCAPDRHDRVADELLDRAAVAVHDLAGGLVVARQDLAGVFGVSRLGDLRGVDEVREQDRDETSFGGRSNGRGFLSLAWPAAGAPCRKAASRLSGPAPLDFPTPIRGGTDKRKSSRSWPSIRPNSCSQSPAVVVAERAPSAYQSWDE